MEKLSKKKKVLSKRVVPKNIIIPAGVELMEAPIRMTLHTRHYLLTIGIGNNHTATLLVDEDSLNAMVEIKPETSIL